MYVVLVDPSRTALKFIYRLLTARGHQVRPFADEHQALKHIQSDLSVEALITSLELTSMSGLELCWEARLLATAAHRQLYILLMSSSQDRHNLAEALDSGADDFISKPPIAEELYARLRSAERLISMQRELVRLATTDALTGVLNRRAFFESARESIGQSTAGDTLSAIMFDLDHFKQVNDVYGHDVGDEVIRAAARAASVEIVMCGRGIVGRLGGEEFAVVLAGQPISQTMGIAERLRARVAGLRLQTPKVRLTVTCSLGVSEWQPGMGVDQLLKLADLALYRAKEGGRNQVQAADISSVVSEQPTAHGHIRSSPRVSAKSTRSDLAQAAR
jgi:diguanylate cyclase (GGDEF)-like protein